jgi:cell division protease FtsH
LEADVNDEAKTPDLSKQDWIDVERQGEWHTNYEQVTINKYLGVTDYRDMTFSQERVSHVEGLYVRYSLDDFLKENGFTIEKVVDLNHDGEYPSSFSNIEYAHKKFRSCLYMGSYMLSKGESRYIFDIDYGTNVTIFKISSHATANPSGQQILADLIAYSGKNNFLKGQKIDPKCNFISFDRAYSWHDLILDKQTKTEVRQNLYNILANTEVYRKNKLTMKRGLIFHGPPGTGKTLLGKILCNVVDWTFIWVTPRHLEDSRDVTRIVGMARDLAPAILFLEDIDLVGADRNENRNLGTLAELMNQLDGIQENRDIITIATTNNVEALEKALLKRPGRFDRVIKFGEPVKDVIVDMLKSFAKDVNLAEDVSFDKMADDLNGLTGAQVRELVNLAVLYAIDTKSFDEQTKILTVKPSHFEKALPSVRKKDFKSLGFTGRGGDGDSAETADPDDFPCPDMDEWPDIPPSFEDRTAR